MRHQVGTQKKKKNVIHMQTIHRVSARLHHSCASLRKQKMAELYKQQLLGFIDNLREAHRIFLKNGRLMASIAAFTTLLYSLLLLSNFLSLRPLLTDLLVKQSLILATSPTSTEFANLLVSMEGDIRLFAGTEWAFVFAYSAASVLLSTATILASALSPNGSQADRARPLDVALAAARCWRRPLITYFYVSMFGVGYFFLLLAILLPVMLPSASAVTIAISICAALLYGYLAVVWTLGMVVAVLEEKSGLEALGKAGQLVKGGMELKGFCLSLLVTLLSLGLVGLWEWATINVRSHYMSLLMGLLLVNGLWLVRMYGLVAFTVLYYEGKRSHGEETEMVLGFDYTKIPSLPVIAENQP